MTPFPTLPRRKLALPWGGQLHSGLRDVEVARPSSSLQQHPSRFAPLLLRFSRKNRPFLALPSLAEHSWSEPAPVAVKILISRKFCDKLSATFCSRGPHVVLRLRNSDFLNCRNVFMIGTYLRLKMKLRIREYLKIFQ